MLACYSSAYIVTYMFLMWLMFLFTSIFKYFPQQNFCVPDAVILRIILLAGTTLTGRKLRFWFKKFKPQLLQLLSNYFPLIGPTSLRITIGLHVGSCTIFMVVPGISSDLNVGPIYVCTEAISRPHGYVTFTNEVQIYSLSKHIYSVYISLIFGWISQQQ